jgi:hypothetical protein
MADDEIVVNPIANAPEIQTPVDCQIPDNYEFEIFRLRRRVEELECAVRDRDDRIRRALGTLDDQLLFWHTLMSDKVGETMGQLNRRIIRLESTLAFIKDIQPHIVPRLETPAHWKKKG